MVKAGYKQTELGVVPTDWEVMPLPELSWFQEGPGLRNWQFTKSGMKVINVTNLENGFLNLENTDRHISLDEFTKSYKHFEIDSGDIVMASSGNSYCKTAIARRRDLPLMMNTSVIRFKPTNDYNYHFLYSYLGSYLFKNQVDLLITGGAQPNFGPYHLRRIYLPVPPPKEQVAIAQALSDVDGLIEALDRLIAKKRAIKTAVMQQLLTGKKRLPGFSEEWKTKTFGECFDFLRTGSNSRRELSEIGDFGYIHYGDIHTKWSLVLDLDQQDVPYVDESKVNNLPLLNDGDLIMADASEDYDGVGLSVEIKNIGDKRVVAGLHTLLLRADKNILADGYKAYLTSIRSVKVALQKIATGISVYGISKKNLQDVQIPIPPTVNEQKVIASILSDIDGEISQIEKKRAKVMVIKLGMMQELLTGRTRLVLG